MIDTLISDFKRPKYIKLVAASDNKNMSTFVASPYEKGVATTIGNSLRRILYSALPGYAIVAVKFNNLSSEFDNIPGVMEDTSMILLNFKQVAITLKDENIKNKILKFEIKGETDFTSGKIQEAEEGIIVGNPDLVVFRSNKDADFSFEIQISQGRGYIPSELIEANVEVRGAIPLDADYSPIKKVGFSSEATKVGSRDDFEKLEITIETKGTIDGVVALQRAAQILKECCLTFSEVDKEVFTTPIEEDLSPEKDSKDLVFYESVHSLNVLVKTHYFFKVNGFLEIGQLVNKNEAYIRSRKKVDEEIIQDIQNSLIQKNLSLNMQGINYVEKVKVH